MSEIKPAYITDAFKMADIPDTPEEMHEIRDEAPHNHYTSIPNMVDDLGLSPYAFRLYCHLKRVAGELGACWQSTNTLAEACQMSMGMISKAKQELTATNPPLIRIERKHKPKPSGDWYHEIKIIDIWAVNSASFSPGERPVSYSENRPSPHESKKNPIKKNQELNTYTAKPDFINLTVQQAAALPELRIFREATGRIPGQGQWETVWSIIRGMNGKGNAEYLRPFWLEWSARGYNPSGLAWLQDWAISGQIPPKNKQGKTPQKSFYDQVMEA
jgi:hypothetical protein